MFYRVNVCGFAASASDCGEGYGTVISRHKDEWIAERTLKRAGQDDCGIENREQIVFETEDNLTVGSQYVEIVHNAHVAFNRQWQVNHVVRALKLMVDGYDRHQAASFSSCLDEFNNRMDFDAWLERFHAAAEAEIQKEENARQQLAEERAQRASTILSFTKAAEEMTFSFPAVRGVQAGKQYFIAQVAFRHIQRFFTFADETLSPELRAQRRVNVSHAEEIAKYILANPDSYVLPSMTVSVSAQMRFDPVEGLEKVGKVHIPMDATLLTNDGQHRSTAISMVLATDKSFAEETISVVFYYDEGLERSKQIFSDLNSNLIKPNAAISALYDVRNDWNRLVLEVIDNSMFKGWVDLENTSIGAASRYVYSLTHVMKFFEKLLNVKAKSVDLDDAKAEKMKSFMTHVVNKLMVDNRRLNAATVASIRAFTPEQLRKECIAGHAVYLESLAMALSDFFDVENGYDAEKLNAAMDAIFSLSTVKTNEVWKNRCVVAERMVKNTDALKLTAALMRQTAGLELSSSLIEALERHNFQTVA